MQSYRFYGLAGNAQVRVTKQKWVDKQMIKYVTIAVYKGLVYSLVSEGSVGAWRQNINNPLSKSIGPIDTASYTQPQPQENWRKKGIQQNFPKMITISRPRQRGPGLWIFLGQNDFTCCNTFLKEQLTVITLAKKSVALRHWPVGKYFSASFKRRPLTGFWKRITAAQEKLALFALQKCVFFSLSLFCPAAGGSAWSSRWLEPRKRGVLPACSLIYGSLAALLIRLISRKWGRFIIRLKWQKTNKNNTIWFNKT